MTFKKYTLTEFCSVLFPTSEWSITRRKNSAKGLLFPAERNPFQVYSAEQNFDNYVTCIRTILCAEGRGSEAWQSWCDVSYDGPNAAGVCRYIILKKTRNTGLELSQFTLDLHLYFILLSSKKQQNQITNY
jgi:hypothetical protein